MIKRFFISADKDKGKTKRSAYYTNWYEKNKELVRERRLLQRKNKAAGVNTVTKEDSMTIKELIEQALITYENRVINNSSKKYRTAELHSISEWTAELIEEVMKNARTL